MGVAIYLGTLDYGSASATTPGNPTYPSGGGAPASRTTFYYLIGMKPTTANGGTVTPPAGWTLVASSLAKGGYGTTTGASVGNTNVYLYKKDTTTGSESGTETGFVVGDSNFSWSQIIRVECQTTGAILSAQFIAGENATGVSNGAQVSVTFGSADVAANDAVFIAEANAGAAGFNSPGGYTLSGVTFGTLNYYQSQLFTGNYLGANRALASATSGSATGTLTYAPSAYGDSTNARGAWLFMRFRELPPISGTLAKTLAALVSAATATSTITGTTAKTLAAVTLSTVTMLGQRPTLAATLGAVTLSSAGTSTITGSAAKTLGAVTLSSAVASTITGTASRTLAGLSATLTATALAAGTLARTLGTLTGSGTITSTISATVARTLGAVTSSATVTSTITGTSARTLGTLTAAGVGAVMVQAMAAPTLAALTGSATVASTISGYVGVSLAAVTSTGTGTSTITGVLAKTLGPLVLLGLGTVRNRPPIIRQAFAAPGGSRLALAAPGADMTERLGFALGGSRTAYAE